MTVNAATGESQRRLIVLIHSDHPNDGETAKPKRQAFAEYGYAVEEFSVDGPGAAQALATLLQQRSQEIFCFISDNFYASKIRDQQNRLLHQITGIPIVFYLHDHPLYFAAEWTPSLDGGIVFAPGQDLIDFIADTYPVKLTGVVNSAFFPPPVVCGEPDFADFSTRANQLFCPMNLAIGGANLDTVWARIKELPPARRLAAQRLAEAALTDVHRPLDVVAKSLSPELPPGDAAAAVGDQLLVLNFLKLWRRNAMIRALIELPILVSSQYVPADLEFKYPGKFTYLSIAETTPLYRRYRFVLNAFPLLVHTLHERVFSALWANSVLVTDRNIAIERYLHDEVDAIFYDYGDAGMARKIARYIDDPQAAFELTERAYDVRQNTRIRSLDAFGDLIEAVKERWAETTVPAGSNVTP